MPHLHDAKNKYSAEFNHRFNSNFILLIPTCPFPWNMCVKKHFLTNSVEIIQKFMK